MEAGVAGLCTAYELEKAGYWAGTFGPAGVDQPGRTIASPGIDPLHHLAEARAHALRMDVDVGAIHVRHDDEVVGRVLANGRGVLCCATHARGLLGEWLLHSTGADLVRRSPEPLVVAGPEVRLEPRPTFTDVVACSDGSALTRPIVSAAARWARRLEAKVRLIRITNHRSGVAAAAWRSTRTLVSTLAGLGVDSLADVIVADDPVPAICRAAGDLDSPS